MNDKTTPETTANGANAQTQTQINQQQADAAKPEKPTPVKAPAAKSAPKAPAPKNVQAAKKATPAPAKPAAKAPPKIITALVGLRFGVMVTLDLTGNEIFGEQNALLKSKLSHFTDAAGNTHNLYQPFKAVTAKTKRKDPNAARGLLRNALGAIYGIAAELEGNKTNYVGEAGNVISILDGVAASLQQRVAAAIGIDPNTVLIDGTPAEAGQPAGLTLHMSDLLSVEAWANTNGHLLDLAEGEGQGENPNLTSQVFVNIRVTPANLFAAEELDNAVLAIFNFLNNSAEKLAADTGVELPCLLALNLNVESLADTRFVELLAFTNAQDWDLYGRRDLAEVADSGEMDWVPADAESATAKLMGNSDVLIVTMTGSDAEEGEAESETEAE